MRTYLILLIIAGVFYSCNQGSSENGSEKKIRKQVLDLGEDYIRSMSKDAVKAIANDGSVIYTAGDIQYLIDPSGIIIGDIDDDSYKDALVTIFAFRGQALPLKKHLILTSRNGKLSISREMDGEMKFLSINDRTIFIETSKAAPDSPFADCQVCKEIRKYKFVDGDTVRIK